jgi:hypothetical protein
VLERGGKANAIFGVLAQLTKGAQVFWSFTICMPPHYAHHDPARDANLEEVDPELKEHIEA